MSFDLSPEQFHELMTAALADSPRAREIVRQAFLPSIPVRGGNPSTNYIVKFTSVGEDDSVIYEDPTTRNIGIGTTTPSHLLTVGDGT